MSYWQDVPPEFADRIGQLSRLFLKSRDTFHVIVGLYRWLPGDRSPAAADAVDLPSPDPDVDSPHGETGHRMIADVVQTLLLTASGHMGALGSLYSSHEVLFSPPLLTRAVIENCAHAVWVLGDDPDEPSEERLARAYLEELLSAEEARKNLGRMHGKTNPAYVLLDAEYKALKAQILSRFPTATKSDLGDRRLNSQRLEGLEDTVLWMYELTMRSGGTISRESASGIYGSLSAKTHPTLYPSRLRRTWVDDPATGFRTANQTMEIGSVEAEARAALAAYYNALTYTTSYFGWPTTALEELETELAATIPTFFR